MTKQKRTAAIDRAERYFKSPEPDECSAATREYQAARAAVLERMMAQKAARLAREAPIPRSK
jgi:hypothetical protein